MSILEMDWNIDDALAVRYEEGEEKGIEKMTQIIKMYNQKKPLNEIAKKVNMSLDKLKLLLKNLGYDM